MGNEVSLYSMEISEFWLFANNSHNKLKRGAGRRKDFSCVASPSLKGRSIMGTTESKVRSIMGTTESKVMQSVRDVNSKKIFQDPLLCSQFLRDKLMRTKMVLIC